MASTFPTDVTLKYVPLTKANKSVLACAPGIPLDLKKVLPGKTVVITGAPNAFSPACSEEHIPDYIKHIDDFKAKGVDQIIVLTANDFFVNSAWGKALGYTSEENYIIFASDFESNLAKKLGDNFVTDLSAAGLGVRNNRYAAIVKDGKIVYLESEGTLDYTPISSAATVLEKL